MNVGEACNREVVTVERGASIIEVARVMRKYHVGDVIVTDDRGGQRIPVGVFTDRDIVVELIAEEIDLGAVNAGEVMTSELVTVAEQEPLSTAIKRMRDHGVRRMPVVNAAGGLVGILAVDDLIDLAAEQLSDLVKLVSVEQRREQNRRP
ncbi:CBS domain-containing protein [Desulfuromonas versatilis]|uniref:CBS domain-containing protein n=1 Tax=Desulfuromonas versatilis TaxID=2802975 RepID=A0ABM8HVV3_9BACT|nr:CBS domain-containing protein [Desulfuromonas versatilis]BCR06453.1 CBS domain-containing protein [Desulfuromonas versatilis]